MRVCVVSMCLYTELYTYTENKIFKLLTFSLNKRFYHVMNYIVFYNKIEGYMQYR